jgi:hypothetical protein
LTMLGGELYQGKVDMEVAKINRGY